MNNTYLSRMNNVQNNKMMRTQNNNQKFKLMRMQIKNKRLDLERKIFGKGQINNNLGISQNIEKIHNLNLLKEYLNLLRIRGFMLLQI